MTSEEIVQIPLTRGIQGGRLRRNRHSGLGTEPPDYNNGSQEAFSDRRICLKVS